MFVVIDMFSYILIYNKLVDRYPRLSCGKCVSDIFLNNFRERKTAMCIILSEFIVTLSGLHLVK